MFGIAVAFAKWVLRDYLDGLEQMKSHYKEAGRESSKNFANAVMEIRNLQTDLSLLASSKADLLDILDDRKKTIDALRSAVEDHQKELEELRKTVVQKEETNQLRVNEIGVLTKDFDSMSEALTAAQKLVEEQQKTIDKLNGLLAKRDAVIAELHKEKASVENRLQNLCKVVDKQICAIRFSIDAEKMCNREQPENVTSDVKVGDWIEWRFNGQWTRSESPVTEISEGNAWWKDEDGYRHAWDLSLCRRTTPPETESCSS